MHAIELQQVALNVGRHHYVVNAVPPHVLHHHGDVGFGGRKLHVVTALGHSAASFEPIAVAAFGRGHRHACHPQGFGEPPPVAAQVDPGRRIDNDRAPGLHLGEVSQRLGQAPHRQACLCNGTGLQSRFTNGLDYVAVVPKHVSHAFQYRCVLFYRVGRESFCPANGQYHVRITLYHYVPGNKVR